MCNSCWAFASVVTIEAAWKIAGNGLENFSEQQILDCSYEFGNSGCDGVGFMDHSYNYLIYMGGLQRSSDYPYEGQDNPCKFDKSKAVGKIRSFDYVPKNDCQTMLSFLQEGPVSAGVSVNGWESYKSGVYSSPVCGTVLNHCVAIVGYGHDEELNKDYYIVRNSWGDTWGEEGYIRLDRNVQTSTGICGVCSRALIPRV